MNEYVLNNQDYGAAMFFVILKMVCPYTRTWRSYINSKLDNTNMSHFKHDIPKSNLHIAEWMNEISIAGESYSEIVRHKFKLYPTLSLPLCKDYIGNKRSEW